MMIFNVLCWVFLAIALGVLISIPPGPVSLLYIEKVLQKQLAQAAGCIGGLFTAELFYLVLTILGYHHYLINHPLLFDLVELFGALLILLIGFKILFSNVWKQRFSSQQATKNERAILLPNHFWGLYRISFLLTLLNPAILLIFIFIIGFYTIIYHQSTWIIYFLICVEVGSLLWFLLLGFILYRIKLSHRALIFFKRVVGIILLLLALFILVKNPILASIFLPHRR